MAAKKDDFFVKQISPKLGGERGARNPRGPTSSHDLVEQMEFLYVEVIQAKNKKENTVVIPVIEITLGNYMSSTKDLPMGQNMEWNQVFAFDKTKGDVLSVTLKDVATTTVIGKRNFKLASEIPSRVPPDARIAPQWYSMQNTQTGHHMDLLMSAWFGTQVDEVYSEAWFSDASAVSPLNVINTRPKVYLAPRLCYLRITIVSGHDLMPSDHKRTPSAYVTAALGDVRLKTGVSPGRNPSWNQDLILVASEPLEGTVVIKVMDRVDEQHEECIGMLEKKLSEMTPLKIPSSAPVLFYDLEMPVKVEPAGDSRRFASRLKMKLATDQAYHVAEECVEYASDFRAYVKGLWPGVLGKLEIGILGATGLKGRDEKKADIDSYVVAKYGNKWARTRTVVNNVAPKWNEQYSWDVYEKCTVVTLGIYDNRKIYQVIGKDVPIGKVRIPLNRVHCDWIYTCSYPIMNLGSSGLKKMEELQLAIRYVNCAELYVWFSAPFRWMLPKTHYKSPVSMYQVDKMRAQAVDLNCANLENTLPPLGSEVVSDMLKPKSKNFSIRRTKANYGRLCIVYKRLTWWVSTLELIRSGKELPPKAGAFGIILVFMFWEYWMLCLASSWLAVILIVLLAVTSGVKTIMHYRNGTPPPPLVSVDLKLWGLEVINLDELAEELDSFPSGEMDVNILKMRYDRLRKIMEQVMSLLGDAAKQGERFLALVDLLIGHPLLSVVSALFCYIILNIFNIFWDYCPIIRIVFCVVILLWLKFPCTRNDLPYAFPNFFRRLPRNEDPI